MPRQESKFTARVCNELRKMNALVYPLVANARAPAGWPDRIIHHTAWRGYVEFKSVNREVTALQRVVASQLWERCPGSVYFLREPGELSRGCSPDEPLPLSISTAAELLHALAEDWVYLHARPDVL